jgi:hypothetical protein
MTTSEKNRQVIHLYLIAADEHYYFGSIQAMYAHFTHEQLGVASQTLYNTWKNEPYITDMAVIRKGRLIQKKQLNITKGELKSKIGRR